MHAVKSPPRHQNSFTLNTFTLNILYISIESYDIMTLHHTCYDTFLILQYRLKDGMWLWNCHVDIRSFRLSYYHLFLPPSLFIKWLRRFSLELSMFSFIEFCVISKSCRWIEKNLSFRYSKIFSFPEILIDIKQILPWWWFFLIHHFYIW